MKDIQEKGKVFIYDVTSSSILKLRATLEGPSSFSKFGASLAFGFPFGTKSSPMLAVGASSLGKYIHMLVLNKFCQNYKRKEAYFIYLVYAFGGLWNRIIIIIIVAVIQN